MRIAIVNDMKMTIEVLKRIVTSVPEYDIAWIAFNGAEAVEKCAADLPDLILMDLIMPVMGGVEATYSIMKNNPCSILIVTSSVSRNTSKVFEAMGYGALDVVSTPVLDLNSNDFTGDQLLKKIETIGKLIGKAPRFGKVEKFHKLRHTESSARKVPPLLIIGSSTGGPIALAKILSHFPENTSFATIITQHVDEQFAPGLAQWLSTQSSSPVQLAYEGARPLRGSVLLAGKNDHLIMTEALYLSYTPFPKETPFRPSVDVLFNSVAEFWPEHSIAVLLTGMGSDGAKGLKVLHDAGWLTIAEHEESCVVYGMPKAAIELGAASEILRLEEIGPALLSYFQKMEE